MGVATEKSVLNYDIPMPTGTGEQAGKDVVVTKLHRKISLCSKQLEHKDIQTNGFLYCDKGSWIVDSFATHLTK